ncbi:general substrate transporter [Mycena floridula]|nr:general substrate transporter [Mycena floridula]
MDPYVYCSLFTALGGLLWGLDTGCIGPITVMPQFESQFGKLSPTVHGLLVSSILITAAVVSIISGPLSDRISRTYTIAIGGVVYAVGAAIACSAGTLTQLFVGRCVTGIGEGLFISSITVYVTEISPAASRGRLASFVQTFNTLGVMIGYFSCYGTVKIPSSFSWRFPIGLQAGIAIFMAIGMPFFPHSPRWLVHVGRHADAELAMFKLGMTVPRKDESRVAAIDAVVAAPIPARTPFWHQAKALWARDVRYRTIFCIFIMGMQQASGIDGVLYYAPVLFKQAGLSSSTATFLASGVSGIIMVVLTFTSQWFQDKWSRRIQMIGGGSVVAGTMLILGTLYAAGASETKAGQYSIIALIYIFIAGFISSWAIVCRIVCSEVQPTKTRAAAASLGQCSNWFVNYIIALTTPLFLARSSSGPYFFFGGCSLLSVLVCLMFQPETKGLDLEVIDEGLAETPLASALRNRFGLRNRAGAEGVSEDIELAEK